MKWQCTGRKERLGREEALRSKRHRVAGAMPGDWGLCAAHAPRAPREASGRQRRLPASWSCSSLSWASLPCILLEEDAPPRGLACLAGLQRSLDAPQAGFQPPSPSLSCVMSAIITAWFWKAWSTTITVWSLQLVLYLSTATRVVRARFEGWYGLAGAGSFSQVGSTHIATIEAAMPSLK